jgi:hypothetical protein
MNTETPHPSPLSNAECLSILTDSHLVGGLTPLQSRALLRAHLTKLLPQASPAQIARLIG